MEALVARIGKPHGLAGEVTVQVHTDAPRTRFTPGATFGTRPPRGTLTLRGARLHRGIWLLAFDEAPDRTAAEQLRGTRLLISRDDRDERAESPGEPSTDAAGASRGAAPDPAPRPCEVRREDGGGPEDGWYPDELIGRAVLDPDGEMIGEVTDLLLRPAQDLLAVRLLDGRQGLVPFVAALVPHVRLDADPPHVVIDAPDGLFDLG